MKFYKHIKTAINNLWFPEVEDKSNDFYKYGTNNQLPNELLRWVNDSGIAKRCVGKVSTYTAANGFVNKALNELKVNIHGEKAAGLVAQIAMQLAYFRGFALHVGRNTEGQAVSFKLMPFEKIRRRTDGNFAYNETLGTNKFKSSEWVVYPKYKGLKIGTKELNQLRDEYDSRGEIYYAYDATPDSPIYPVPEYYAGIEDVRSSAEIARYDLETALNGFVPSALLTIVGNIDNTVKDEHGRTQQDYLDETLDSFTGSIKDSQGLSNRAKLLVMHAATAEEIPNLQAFNANEVLSASIAKRDAIDRNVCRLFGVHPVLMGFSDAAILGNTQSIANASNELNNNVAPLQRLIERFFNECMPQYTWELTQFKPRSNASISEKLQQAGIQNIMAIINAQITPEQKSTALQILFELPESETVKLAGISSPVTPTTNE